MASLFVSQLKPKKSFLLTSKNNLFFTEIRKKPGTIVYCQENCHKNLNLAADSSVKRNICIPVKKINDYNIGNGIGIVKFLQGKTFLITGATGLLSKVLVEKILRSVPNIEKIYLIIKARNKEAAMRRVQTEIIDAEIFKCLKEKYGKSYQNFMLSKLVAVVGDICEPDLGLEADMADQISTEVHIIINSAANTNFYERYDVSININTRGPSHLLNFAQSCKNMELFLQVSTAYVCGTRNGRIMEKVLEMGREEMANVESEIQYQLATSQAEAFHNNSFMTKLGLERSKKYGWHDTYTFTKAMGEMIICEKKGEVPTVIIRPTIIESTYRDPFPGWIQGNRMVDPIITLYGKGQITGFLANPHSFVDIVPADMVVNAILAAIAKHGKKKEANVNIYHVASSIVNPLTLEQLFGQFYEHFKSSPRFDPYGRGTPVNVETPLKLYSNMEEFSIHLEKDIGRERAPMATYFKNSRKAETLIQKLKEYTTHMATTYKPYCFYEARFDCNNLQKLMESMSEEEREEFGFDFQSIDWNHYIKSIHIPGLRKHVLRDNQQPVL